ncbi:MAG: acylneuraminate cytidylyltransferase family protein [Candidatus Omnitrophota bacterium]
MIFTPSKKTKMMPGKFDTLGLITARGGSKRLPGKNVKNLLGKPLIAWTAEAALKSRFLDHVILSTDDRRIAAVARKWGVGVPFMRPAALAKDGTPHMDVLIHVLRWLEEHEKRLPEYIVLLQPTSPLRTADDIDAAIEIAIKNNADAVVSVFEIQKNTTLVWQLTGKGMLRKIKYYQDRPVAACFAPNGAIYVIRSSVLKEKKTLYPRRSFPYIMPASRSLDIDTPWDFHMAELILKNKMPSPTNRGITVVRR